MKLRRLAPLLLIALAAPRMAEAHFLLLEPATWTDENFLGDPQKAEPCGGEGGTPTGAITQFQVGETITLRWEETIYHPGHWRIALAEDRADLVDPAVQLDANQVSISADIQDPPVPPVLLDNLFPRTSPNGSPGMVFEQQITLPNTPCAHCTVQVIQFMLGHGPPNYIYHHCADIEIVDDTPPPPDAGMTGQDATVMDMDTGVAMEAGTPAPDAMVPADSGQTGSPDAAAPKDSGPMLGDDAGEGENVDGGCGCSAASERNGSLASALLLPLFALVWVRRATVDWARRRARSN